MQFPVPQFTDVEDKLFGPLTLKQFGIIFGAGVVVFLGYSATKSVLVLIFLCLVFGIPALGLAFAKVNGRPVYNTIGSFVKFLTAPKVLVFHKEAQSPKAAQNMKDAAAAQSQSTQTAPPAQDTQANLRQVQELLRKTASEEQDIAGKIK